MPGDLQLGALQQWMQAVVTHTGEVYDAVAAEEAEAFRPGDRIGDVVLPSKTLDPIQRVGIYHGMYPMRMVEALAADYPALSRFMGEHNFEHLVLDFIQEFPSRSYTLNRLGDRLPDYIARCCFAGRGFLHDLARLELAMTEVFDEAEVAPMASDAISAVPPDAIESIRFTPIAALRLLALRYDASSAFQAFRNDMAIQPRRVPTWVAIHRRDYSVHCMPISREAFWFLRGLMTGKTIAQVLDRFHRRFDRMPGQHELFAWFRDWNAAGFFASMTT